jgi:predicted nucleic acid-binding protein
VVTFVDTSALYAYLDASDANHGPARASLRAMLEARDDLVTTSYVVVETSALVQRRLGARAVRVLHEELLPIVRVTWVTETAHRLAVSAMLASLNRGVSLVDHVSFITMRELGLERALTFDEDFGSQGFDLIPSR